MMATRKIDDLGRVVIPGYLRQSLGWNENTAVTFELHGDKVLLTKAAEELEEGETSTTYKY